MPPRKKKEPKPTTDEEAAQRKRHAHLGMMAHDLMKAMGTGRLVRVTLNRHRIVDDFIASKRADVPSEEAALTAENMRMGYSNLSFTTQNGTRFELNDVQSVL